MANKANFHQSIIQINTKYGDTRLGESGPATAARAV